MGNSGTSHSRLATQLVERRSCHFIRGPLKTALRKYEASRSASQSRASVLKCRTRMPAKPMSSGRAAPPPNPPCRTRASRMSSALPAPRRRARRKSGPAGEPAGPVGRSGPNTARRPRATRHAPASGSRAACRFRVYRSRARRSARFWRGTVPVGAGDAACRRSAVPAGRPHRGPAGSSPVQSAAMTSLPGSHKLMRPSGWMVTSWVSSW